MAAEVVVVAVVGPNSHSWPNQGPPLVVDQRAALVDVDDVLLVHAAAYAAAEEEEEQEQKEEKKVLLHVRSIRRNLGLCCCRFHW